MTRVPLSGPYITLQHALKSVGLISTGGSVKWFLQEENVTVNGVREQRRGRKLYEGDIVACSGEELLIVTPETSNNED